MARISVEVVECRRIIAHCGDADRLLAAYGGCWRAHRLIINSLLRFRNLAGAGHGSVSGAVRQADPGTFAGRLIAYARLVRGEILKARA
jgi:hypothetical protein